MPKKVPYLHEEQIERDAEALLAEYERARGIQIVAPVPIEDIVEKYLKLGVEFDDMHQLLGVPRSREPDILGAMLFDERRIVRDRGRCTAYPSVRFTGVQKEKGPISRAIFIILT